MKKIITCSLTLLFIFSLSFKLYAQCLTCDDPEYSNKKAQFWKEYLVYKNNIDNNIVAIKPIDPSGLFYIDENNHFNVKAPEYTFTSPIKWFGERDAVSSYIFSQSTGTYASINTTGTLDTSGCDDGYNKKPIGFTFNFNGTNYDTVTITCNGWIMMGQGAPSGYSPICTGSYPNVIVPFARDLRGGPGASDNGIYFQTTGSAPNRIFTVEWYHWGIYSLGNNEIDFQVKLYETSNKIEFIYKPETPSSSLTDVQVGLMGTTNADFYTRTQTTGWLNTSAGVACSYNTFNSGNYPPAGLTFTWLPPPSGIMGYYSSAATQIAPGVPIPPGTINAQIIKVAVTDTGISSPISISNFKFQTTGSNNPPADIVNAKLYYTGSTNTFSTTTQYGSTISNPNGVFYITGAQNLIANATNYFWLTYDINASANTGDSVDAQCDSITGTNAMGTVAPNPSAPFGSNPIDPYCLGQVSNPGCPYGLYIANVTMGTINNTTGCNGNLPYCYTNYTNLSTQVRINNPYQITISNQLNPNVTAYGVYIDWNNNNSFADGGEYFPTTIIPANSTVPATVSITVPAGATLGNHRMRIRTNLSSPPGAANYCATLGYGEQEDYKLVVIADTNMTYSSGTTDQTNVSPIYAPYTNAQIIGIQVNTFGSISPLNATSFTLNTNGSTNPSTDISRAKLWYTGASPVYAATTLYGTYVSPNSTFTITGTQQLVPGTNYFWLTYDIPSSAVTNNVVDAECNSILVGGISRIPTIQAPVGNRTIAGTSMSGIYTIPGSYVNFNTAITDLNNRGISGPVTFNVAAGFIDTAANLVISTTGTASNPIVFRNASPEPRANPIIVAGVGTGTTDGIIKINGGDYITFDGIDLQENPANTTTAAQMEWGYALVKPDGTNGCQNVTIKNCAVTLNKTNTSSTGIYSNNHSAISTATFVVSVTAGANSNNTFLNNTITNCYNGIWINGYADASPYTLYDQNNTINGCTISNYGGSTTTAYGIYGSFQNLYTVTGCNINSAGGTNSTGILAGIYGATMTNSNIDITNNTISLTNAGTATTVYCIYNSGSTATNNNVNILNNTIQNCNLTAATSSSFYGIYNGMPAYNLTESGNRIIGYNYGTPGVSTGTVVYSIYNISAIINSITITNNLDSGNTINGTSAYTNYRIYNGVSTLNCTITGNRIRNNILCGTTAASTVYGIYNSSGTFTCNMSNNIVSDNNLPTTSSHSMYFLYNLSSAPAQDYNNNTVSGNTSSGSGTLYGVYYSASPGLNSTVNINNNSVTNLSKTTATGAGGIYGIYQASTPQGTLNINNNTVTGFTSAAATLFAGIYQGSSPPNYVNINNNRVGNFTNAGVSTIYGILSSATSSTQLNISGDSVYNITSAGSTLYGIYLSSSGLNWNVYKNSVSGLTSNTGTTATAHGIYDAVSLAGSTLNIYNNMISDINTPASTSIAPALSGIYVASGSSTTTVNLLYNTILLNSTSSGTTFGTAGIYALTTPVVTLKNNVIVNKSTPGGSGGQTVAYRRSSITLTTYGSGSNNNCFYAGGPAANRLIYYDGTNSDQTIAAYKSRVNPRDNASVTENPPFVNGSAPPYDLRIQTAVATQLESGGQIISSPVNIIDDKFAVARYPNAGYPIGGFTPTAPDMGANEFGGLNADTAAPFISYAPLGNGGTTNRTFNNVIITDANGVNIAPGTKPRCYYKRSLDSNVVNDTTNITDGWKFVEATGTTSPFTFIIDYSKLVGGTGVTAGQVVQYFVIAQDLSTLSNVGYNQAVFTTPPSTVNVVSSNAPITGTLSYNIVTNIFSGSYNVGTSQTYTSLTGAGGLFASINAGVVSGDITALITSDLVEDGTNALNLFNETGAGGYRLRIIPSDATLKTISGAVAQGMIRFNGSRRVTIDGGSFFADQTHRINLSGNLDAPGKYLTFRNTNGSNPTFTFINDAVGDSIKYCNIESNNISTATTTAGTILFSTTTGTQGNDSNVIAFCDIRDRSDATGTPAFGIYNNGSTTTPQQYNSYNVVTNCNVYNYFYDAAVFTGGIWLNSGTTDWVITGNSFYQTVPRTLTLGATFASIYNNISTLNNNNQITNNYIGGNAPQCGGSPMTYTGAATYSVFGIQAFVSTQVPTNITGNTIRNINLTSSAASSTAALFKGIYAQTGWINVSNNTVGADTGTGSITITINNNISSINPVAMIHCASLGNITNNKVGSITIGGNATSTADLYAGIYMTSSFAGQTYNISNNLIGSLTTPNSIQVTNLVNGHQLRGIYNVTGSAGSTINVSNNTIANLTSFQTSAVNTASVFGIQNNGGTGNYNFANNTVRNLTSNTNANANATLLLNGLFNSGSGINTYSQNSIYTIYGNGTTGMFLMNGIFASGTVGGTISRNKIFDLRLNETGTVGTIVPLEGLNLQSTGAYTVSNNMISITNGDATDYILKMQPNSDARLKIPNEEPSKVVGIIRENELTSIEAAEKEKLVQHQNADFTNDLRENVTPKTKEKPTGKIEGDNSTVNIPIAGILQQSTSPSPNNYYYNTVYVGGNQPGGSYNSYAFQRQNGGNTVLRNNLLINARTGGGGNHYVIGNENTNPLAGWPATASNYNALLGSNASTICEWGVGNSQTIQQWVTSSSGDKQSWSTTTATILPSNLLTNIATCDLTVQSANAAAWLVSGKGIALSSVNIDFTGDSRVTAISGGCTDIGADEFTATPPSNPVATQTGTPGPGATTTYSLYGRTILSIDWGVGGISYPTLMSVTYYSGINPTPAITSPNRNSNSYWTVVPIGSLTGTTYNATLFFGDNETYNITSPSTNTLLAKYTNTFWQVFPAGSGLDQFSIVDWGNLAVTTGGLSTFSTFALSDAALPSIILATPANNSTSSTLTPTFTWNRSAGSTTHRIQVATDSLFGTIVRDTVTADTSKVFAAFTNNTSYWWRAYGTNSIGTGAWSQIFKFRVVSGPPPPAIVNLKVIPGGFYNTSTGTLNMRDTIRALLIDSTGCLRSDSTKAVLDSVTFTANISFANASTGNYYLYVFHRNHVFISARYEQSIIRGSTVSYDFTTDSSKTYGNNVIKVATSPVLWGMIPGEANQDGYVDGLDQTLWIFDNGLEGYRSTDFNGDLYVDGLDQTIWILMNGLNYSVPCELTFENVTEHTRKVQMINNREIERIYTPKQNK